MAIAIVGLAFVLAAVAAAAILGVTERGETSPRQAVRAGDSSPCRRPYTDWSPWNTPIVDPIRDSSSRGRLPVLADPLTSDPTQYTYPVYEVRARAARRPVQLDGWYSDVDAAGGSLHLRRRPTVQLPVPADARPASGSDGQIILVDASSGDEWGAWRFDSRGDGTLSATNAYHYNTAWSGVPPRTRGNEPFVSRGAGVPYLAGLVRPCEIARGRIDHALALAYPYPSARHVYPATKSDGRGSPEDLPEGTRLQLDPQLGDDELRDRGCDDACLTIARALKRYGMYVIDNGGRPKVMVEYEETAQWDGAVTAGTPSPIPLARLQVVVDSRPLVRALPSRSVPGRAVPLRYAVFDRGNATREVVTVSVGGRRVAILRRAFHVPTSRRVTTVPWAARRSAQRAVFCVQAWDPAGHASRRSCSSIGGS